MALVRAPRTQVAVRTFYSKIKGIESFPMKEADILARCSADTNSFSVGREIIPD